MDFVRKKYLFLKWCRTHAAHYLLMGAIFGFIFPLIAITIDIHRLNLEFSWSAVVHIHNNFPIHYIIDTAPLFLGLFALIGGKAMDKVEIKNVQILKASRFKDNFLAIMSHEIRTPMAGIIGVIDLLSKRSNMQAKDMEYLEIMRTSSNDLVNIINDILDLSKLEAGKLNIHRMPVNIRKLGTDICNLFGAVSLAKNIELQLKVDENVPEYVQIDTIRIKQILSNFIGNAIKFSESGTVALKISHKSERDNNLKFEVNDEGIGIPEEQLDSVFSAYKQLEDSNEKRIKGTGLGLFISKGLVKLMEGDLGVNSEYGKGSNFWFSIKAEVANGTHVYMEKQNPKMKRPRNLGLRVLMVEDNKTLCTLYQRMLLKLGCQVVIIHNGKELIEIFKEGLYDIVLLDINMPIMGGVEAMEYLKSNFKDVPPIIASSASALKSDIDKYMALGFDDYITKPFTINQLGIKLKEWIQILNKEGVSSQR